MEAMNKLKVTSCFCNKGIESNKTDPCDLNLLINWDKEKSKQYNQSFYCHFACFKQSLNDEIKPHLVLETLLNDQ